MIDTIIQFFTSIGNFFVNVIHDLLAFFRILLNSASLVTSFLSWIPGELVVFLVWIVSLAVLLKIVGRS